MLGHLVLLEGFDHAYYEGLKGHLGSPKYRKYSLKNENIALIELFSAHRGAGAYSCIPLLLYAHWIPLKLQANGKYS